MASWVDEYCGYAGLYPGAVASLTPDGEYVPYKDPELHHPVGICGRPPAGENCLMYHAEGIPVVTGGAIVMHTGAPIGATLYLHPDGSVSPRTPRAGERRIRMGTVVSDSQVVVDVVHFGIEK